MNRQAAVADRFYPGEKRKLTQMIEKYLPSPRKKPQKAIAVVSPHAGYIYSGKVCAETLAGITIPETVIILGPNHRGAGTPAALSRSTWHMPMGDVPTATVFCDMLLHHSTFIEIDEDAHRMEHSLEVQVPFLQFFQKNLSIVPLCVSHLSLTQCLDIALSLTQTMVEYNNPVLLVASSDMSHYESRDSASHKDHMALDRLLALDPEGLYTTVHHNRISMCGIIPVTIALLAAIKLGADTAELIRYTDSGEVSGDIDQVVGYAGAVIRMVT